MQINKSVNSTKVELLRRIHRIHINENFSATTLNINTGYNEINEKNRMNVSQCCQADYYSMFGAVSNLPHVSLGQCYPV